MSSPEHIAYPILKAHDVSYVLVIFGALIGYSGDDINKFLWMIRYVHCFTYDFKTSNMSVSSCIQYRARCMA